MVKFQSEIQKSLTEQGYKNIDEKGYAHCVHCGCRTMPGVDQCYDCWLKEYPY